MGPVERFVLRTAVAQRPPADSFDCPADCKGMAEFRLPAPPTGLEGRADLRPGFPFAWVLAGQGQFPQVGDGREFAGVSDVFSDRPGQVFIGDISERSLEDRDGVGKDGRIRVSRDERRE